MGPRTASMPRYGHRSEPQTHVAGRRMIASVGSTIVGASRSLSVARRVRVEPSTSSEESRRMLWSLATRYLANGPTVKAWLDDCRVVPEGSPNSKRRRSAMVDVDRQRDQLVERLFSAGLGMGELMTVYLGDVLGLYRALEQAGAMAAPELAKETGIFERYAREWLEQQAAAGILEGDDVSAAPDERRDILPPGDGEPPL